MSKYYTPKIEEFYIGFECEIESSYGMQKGVYPSILQKDTLTGFTLNKLGESETLKKVLSSIRVKYLDKKDIEDLGFKQMSGNWYHDGKTYQMIGNYKSLEISRGKHEHRDILFQGTVKNKSELKKLLKQLNIIP